MSRLAAKYPGLRPFLHKFRKVFLKLLGINDQFAYHLFSKIGVTYKDQLLRISDRLNIIESQFNWRLYGLPSRVANIKLEQVQLLASAGDVEWALETLRQREIKESIALKPILDRYLKPSSLSLAYIIPGARNHELAQLSSYFIDSGDVIVIDDDCDLYRSDEDSQDLEKTYARFKTLRLSISSSFACFSEPEYEFAWLSSSLERLTPLQTQIFFKRIQMGLKKGGLCLGYFCDYNLADKGAYWNDPRRLRPITEKYIRQLAENAGYTKITFEPQGSSGLIYFSIEKT